MIHFWESLWFIENWKLELGWSDRFRTDQAPSLKGSQATVEAGSHLCFLIHLEDSLRNPARRWLTDLVCISVILRYWLPWLVNMLSQICLNKIWVHIFKFLLMLSYCMLNWFSLFFVFVNVCVMPLLLIVSICAHESGIIRPFLSSLWSLPICMHILL